MPALVSGLLDMHREPNMPCLAERVLTLGSGVVPIRDGDKRCSRATHDPTESLKLDVLHSDGGDFNIRCGPGQKHFRYSGSWQ